MVTVIAMRYGMVIVFDHLLMEIPFHIFGPCMWIQICWQKKRFLMSDVGPFISNLKGVWYYRRRYDQCFNALNLHGYVLVNGI